MPCVARLLLALSTALSLPVLLVADEKPKTRTLDVMVAMQDGTKLATTVYLPEGPGPFPVIVSRTPYDKNGLKGEATRFVHHGYAFVTQDLRGRFKSEGQDAIIFHNDGWQKPHDGHDTLRWISGQSWCNAQ